MYVIMARHVEGALLNTNTGCMYHEGHEEG